jgi:predicted ATPase
VVPKIREIQIKDYKSIGQAVVRLADFTALVGPNGVGKSNFVDALAFVQECLADSIELAFKNRGGIGAVRRRSGGHPTHIGIRVTVDLDSETAADYSFEIAAKQKERFRVAKERCAITRLFGSTDSFSTERGVFQEGIPGLRPQVAPDRLALFAASATDEYRPLYDFLTSIRTYSIAPEQLRELQEPDAGTFLTRNGSNAAAVLKRLKDEDDESYLRVCRLLAQVVRGVHEVDHRAVGHRETLQFRQDVGLKHPWKFDALSMSDGTLRMLGLLLAVYQPDTPPVVAIEEPEATVHPAASEVLTGILIDAAKKSQVVITTHSPDILDHKELRDEQIRVVTKQEGRTLIAPLAATSRQAIRDHLYTPGELLRMDELSADVEQAELAGEQLRLFGRPAEPAIEVL